MIFRRRDIFKKSVGVDKIVAVTLVTLIFWLPVFRDETLSNLAVSTRVRFGGS